MNLVWMALIAVVLSLERVVDRGERVARGTGVAAGIAGVVLVVSAAV
jgi:predicted metal-binding membrane protein